MNVKLVNKEQITYNKFNILYLKKGRIKNLSFPKYFTPHLTGLNYLKQKPPGIIPT